LLKLLRTHRAALVLAGGLVPVLAGCGGDLSAADAPAAAAGVPAAGVSAAAAGVPAAGVPAPEFEVAAPAVAAARTAAPAASRGAARPAFGDHVLQVASRYAGIPYAWGGTTPRGFDCSGFTRYVYAKFGKQLPRTSHQQFQGAHKVAKKHVRNGDLIFYHARGGHVYHVGIYADGQVWHAPNPGKRVKLGKIYAKRWTGGRY
jgi:cell wall-associated NlpC family hydrolase